MKKFIVLLLAALMIVGLCVSCSDPKLPVASDEIVDDVVDATIGQFECFYFPVYRIATDDDPEEVADDLEDTLKDIYSHLFENPTVTTDATENSIEANVEDADKINKFSVKITGIKLSDDNEFIGADFSFSAAGRDEGVSKSLSVSGHFDFTENPEKESTASYSSVTYCGKKYDVAKFNEALKEAIEEANEGNLT